MPIERPFAARRALLHPLWLISLALLVLNDHALKGSGRLPGVVTGKLSDFAGLIVAPALLAAILRLTSRRGIVLAHLATGAVFAAIKLSPTVAHAVEALSALTPFPWRIWVDPTDLMALPSLFVSYHVLVPAMARPANERRGLQTTAAVAGAVACMATSQENVPCDANNCGGFVAQEQASLVIGNATTSERLVRVRPLKDTVKVDCSNMLIDPENKLSRELFGPAQAWLLQPDRGLPLQNEPGDCSAYLVDADGLSPVLLAWSNEQFPTGVFSTIVSQPSPGVTINMSLDSNGKLSLDETHPAVFSAPPLEDPPAAPGCAAPDAGVGIAWSSPMPSGPNPIVSIESSPDGCHGLNFGAKGTVYVCIPGAAMPFQAGDVLEFNTNLIIAGAGMPESNGEPPNAKLLLMRTSTHAVLAVTGNVLARYQFTGSAETLTEPTVATETAQGCAGAHDTCGSLLEPLEISYLGDHVPMISFLRAGTKLDLADGYGTLHVVRAEGMPIRDTSCPPFAESAFHYESVLVVPLVP